MICSEFCDIINSITMANESKNLMAKIPPQNIEAEKSVLGSLMLDSKSIDVIIDILRPNDFYQTKHKIIYEAMFDLYQNKEPIDVLSLSSRLKDKKNSSTPPEAVLT